MPDQVNIPGPGAGLSEQRAPEGGGQGADLMKPAHSTGAINTRPKQPPAANTGGADHSQFPSGVPHRPASPASKGYTPDETDNSDSKPANIINYSDGGTVSGVGKYQPGNTNANANNDRGYNRNGGGYNGGGRGYGFGYGSRYGNSDYGHYYDTGAAPGQGLWNNGGSSDYDYYNLDAGMQAWLVLSVGIVTLLAYGSHKGCSTLYAHGNLSDTFYVCFAFGSIILCYLSRQYTT